MYTTYDVIVEGNPPQLQNSVTLYKELPNSAIAEEDLPQLAPKMLNQSICQSSNMGELI